jgi:ferredoxin-NADP reductase
MWHRATIQSRKQLSPTVTGLTLKIEQLSEINLLNFTFSPGQWVDFEPLPNNTSWKPPSDDGKGGTIGGYSITSIPQSLPYIDLAIQKSRHPVANWVTACADVNDMVQLRVGGSFTYTDATATSNDKQRRLLFIAGGVGINPLFSMIQQWHVNQTAEKNDNTVVDSSSSRAVLLYSGRSHESLLFVDELNTMVGKLSDQFRVVLTTTTTTSSSSSGVEGATVAASPEHGDKNMEHITFKSGRIDHDMIDDAIVWLNKGKNRAEENHQQQLEGEDGDDENNMMADLVYVCGPPGMPEDIQGMLLSNKNNEGNGVKKFVRSAEDVHFEKWW